MFDKIKDLNKLRKTQGEMKKQMEQIFVSSQKGNISLLVRGDKHIEKIEIAGVENGEALAKELKEIVNDTLKLVDKKVEKQMRGQLGDLGIPGL